MELTQSQFATLMKRFPDFELSYETISHKKVSASYNLAMALPYGKKYFLWFTYHSDRDVLYVLDINRDKKIIKATQYPYPKYDGISLGTILYGTLLEKREGMLPYLGERFIVEDIYCFEGIPMKKMKIIEKLGFLEKTMSKLADCREPFQLFLPAMWKYSSSSDEECLPTTIPPAIVCHLAYPVHHIQYRATHHIMPFLNCRRTDSPIHCGISSQHSLSVRAPISSTSPPSTCLYLPVPSNTFRPDFSKPQYRYSSVFQVVADLQYDIYHLFAYGRNKLPSYYGIAYVPTYRSSVFLNGLFRKIRENKNLDYIEESDDEEDFENIAEDKYVDTNKVLLMECAYYPKFRKWVPTRVVPKGTKIVHINTL
jgi:hypothetical protein